MLLYGEQRGLGVERVEDGFDHQHIRAAIQQAAYRHAVAFDQRVEADISEAGVVYIWRDRRSLGGRAQHARDETRLVGNLRLEFIAHVACQSCTRKIQIVSQLHHVVIVQRCGGGVECAGLQNVRARRQILRVNLADDVRLGEQQQVVVALYIHGVVGKHSARTTVIAIQLRAAIMRLGELVSLDHRTHRAVQNQDALLDELLD